MNCPTTKELVAQGKLNGIVARYPIRESSAFSEIAKALRFKDRKDYEKAVIALIRKDKELARRHQRASRTSCWCSCNFGTNSSSISNMICWIGPLIVEKRRQAMNRCQRCGRWLPTLLCYGCGQNLCDTCWDEHAEFGCTKANYPPTR